MSFYDLNKNLIRYAYSHMKERGVFYIGVDLMHELQFKTGDTLIMTKEGRKKTYIIEKNIFGEKIYKYSSKVSGANFVRLSIPKKQTSILKLPEAEKIIILEHKIYLQENPDDNYIMVKFRCKQK